MKIDHKIDCPCCFEKKNKLDSSIKYENYYIKPEFGLKLFDNRNLFICNNCNFSYSTPFIGDNELDNYYSKYFSKRRYRSMFIQAKKSFSFNYVTLQRIFFACGFLKKKNKYIMLDFGGSDGSTAQQLKNLFPDSSVSVCDNNVYKEFWKLRKVSFKDLNDYKDNEIDFIYSSHTLEHINANKLNNLLAAIKSKLSDGGIAYIEVPNDNFSKFKNSVKKNEGVHISHFTKKSLEYIMTRYFKIIDISVRGSKRKTLENIDIEDFKKNKTTFKNKIKEYFAKNALLRMFRKLTDLYYIYFSKIDMDKKLVNNKFFIKNKDDNYGSIISVLVKNEIKN